MATGKLLSDLGEIDKQITTSMKFLTPVGHGKNELGQDVVSYMKYQGVKPSGLMDKMDYARLYGAEPRPVVNVTDEDVKRVKQTAMLSRIQEFNDWIGARFSPYENPANREVLRKVYPEWFEGQKKAIEDWHKLKQRSEELKVIGPTSKEDLYFMWKMFGQKDAELLAKLDSPVGLRPMTLEDRNKRGFVRGILNRHQQWEDAIALSKAGLIGDTGEEDLGSLANPFSGKQFSNQ
jgi:hypothetical protein